MKKRVFFGLIGITTTAWVPLQALAMWGGGSGADVIGRLQNTEAVLPHVNIQVLPSSLNPPNTTGLVEPHEEESTELISVHHEAKGVTALKEASNAAFFAAIKANNMVEVEVLLKAHAVDVNTLNAKGKTALQWLQRKQSRYVAMAKLLLQYKAHVQGIHFYWAVDLRDIELARMLIEAGVPVNESHDSIGKTALHWIPQRYEVAQGDAACAMAQLLLDNGAQVDAVTHWNITPLMQALMEEHVQLARLLVVNKADVNAQDNQGRSILRWAVNLNSEAAALAMVQLLEKYDVKLEIEDPHSAMDPLWLAIQNQYVEVAAHLLKMGASTWLNIQNRHDGGTPVHEAAKYGQEPMQQLLLKNGADHLTIKNHAGKTPRDIAVEKSKATVGRQFW